jgi:hypothetical protein
MGPYSSVMFTDGGMDDTAIKQDLGGIGDVVEDGQGLLELLIVIVTQRFDPSFNFL